MFASMHLRALRASSLVGNVWREYVSIYTLFKHWNCGEPMWIAGRLYFFVWLLCGLRLCLRLCPYRRRQKGFLEEPLSTTPGAAPVSLRGRAPRVWKGPPVPQRNEQTKPNFDRCNRSPVPIEGINTETQGQTTNKEVKPNQYTLSYFNI